VEDDVDPASNRGEHVCSLVRVSEGRFAEAMGLVGGRGNGALGERGLRRRGRLEVDLDSVHSVVEEPLRRDRRLRGVCHLGGGKGHEAQDGKNPLRRKGARRDERLSGREDPPSRHLGGLDPGAEAPRVLPGRPRVEDRNVGRAAEPRSTARTNRDPR
jgi:hypothetical protein